MTAEAFPTLRTTLADLDLSPDENELGRLIQLLEAMQQFRVTSGNSNTREITRSTALVALDTMNPAVEQGLTRAGLKWQEYRSDLRLQEPLELPQVDVDDVALHRNLHQAITEFSKPADRSRPITEFLSLAIARMASRSDAGLVKNRLQSHGADTDILVDGLLEAFDAAKTTSSEGTDSLSGSRPTLWLLHYNDVEGTEPLLSSDEEQPEIAWRSSKKVKGISPGDPVIYWRDISNTEIKPSGIVGTGRFVDGGPRSPEQLQVKQSKTSTEYHYPTRIGEVYLDDTIERDEVIEDTGFDLNLSRGAILEVPRETAIEIDRLLAQKGRAGLGLNKPWEAEIAFIGDAPESEDDYLNRGDLAFILAARLNRVWTGINKVGHRNRSELDDSPNKSFVVHIDAPWGGGKTSFANYLVRILNPYRNRNDPPAWLQSLPFHDKNTWSDEFRRPWHVVSFNAWQHQHIDPPWWCFYQAIRRQCVRSVRTLKTAPRTKIPDNRGWAPPDPSEENRLHWWLARHLRGFWLWLMEFSWRLFSPKTALLFLTFLFTVVAAKVLQQRDLFDPGVIKTALIGGVGEAASIPSLLTTAVVVLLGGATALWSLFSAVTDTLLPGTPDAAKNYSLGSGDPLERFRRHFNRMINTFKRPVIVVVDDIDRCKPDFVVALLQGMQTIFRCSRVVFVLLGDRDWIEKAFAKVHEAMVDIDVGPEHTFGGRFVEKTIQLSLVLPDITMDVRTEYVRNTLGVGPSPEESPSEEDEATLRSLEDDLDGALEIGETLRRDARTADLRRRAEEVGLEKTTRDAFLNRLDRDTALRSAADERAQKATQHRLVPIADVLPSNPRQIKRIINGVALFQEIGRRIHGIQPESRQWCNLALWVVVMNEWPRTWATLSRYPRLIDRVRNPDDNQETVGPDSETEEAWIDSIKSKPGLMSILDFNRDDEPWNQAGLDAAAIELLSEIMPAAGSVLLEGPADKERKPDS